MKTSYEGSWKFDMGVLKALVTHYPSAKCPIFSTHTEGQAWRPSAAEEDLARDHLDSLSRETKKVPPPP